jgi:HK97 family phage major capsid protein
MADETKSPEILAIEQVSKQVDGFKKDLGERANKAEVAEVKALLEDLKKNIGTMSEKQIDERLDKINKANEKFEKQLNEMIEDVQKTKDAKGGEAKKFQLYEQADLQKFINDTFEDNGKGSKTHVKATLKMNGGLILKAAEIMGYPDFFNGDGSNPTDFTPFIGRTIDPVLYQRKRKRNFILDNFTIPTIGTKRLIYLEKVEVAGDSASQEDSGGAAWIVPGQIKPMRSFRVISKTADAKKIAIFGTVHDELLRDLPSMENWIREDFTDEIRETYNDGLLNNDPGVNENAPLGLKENAIQYADTAAFNNTIATPNHIDAIIAAIAYMASLKEEPQLVVVSSSIFYRLLVIKDSEGRYQNSNLIYTSALGQLYIAGVRVTMADVEDIPDTHVMILGADAFKIRNFGSLVFERGLNGEDFRYDRTSFRAYQEVVSYIPSHRYNGVLYDAIQTIITAITLP